MLTVALGFNGGSALAANLRAAQACIVTNLAASVGGMTWMFWVCTFAQPPHIMNLVRLIRYPVIGLPHRTQVVRGWILFWGHRWTGSNHPGLWFRWRPYVSTIVRRKLPWNTHHSFSIAAAVLFGFLAGTLCNFATQLKFLAGYDDALDVSSLLYESCFKISDFPPL